MDGIILSILKDYRRGEEKFTRILGRLNIVNPASSWVGPEGLLKQFEDNKHRDEFTLFYMVDEADEGEYDAHYVVHKEVFQKLPQTT